MKKSNFQNVKFNVAGVTFKNPDGKNRQSIIKKILNEYKKEDYYSTYGGYSNKEIKEMNLTVFEYEDFILDDVKIIESCYKNEVAYEIHLMDINDTYHLIGFAPKNIISELKYYLSNYSIEKISATFVGGKYKELDYDNNSDKEIVVIKNELDLGVVINIAFKINDTYVCNRCKQEISEIEEKINSGICTKCIDSQKYCDTCGSLIEDEQDYIRYSGMCLNCYNNSLNNDKILKTIITLALTLIFLYCIGKLLNVF